RDEISRRSVRRKAGCVRLVGARGIERTRGGRDPRCETEHRVLSAAPGARRFSRCARQGRRSGGQPMMEVQELERVLLEGARKELAPSASDRMRIQSRLVGNTAWFEPAPVRRSVLRGLTSSWRGGLALGFAVGALLGFGASRGVGYASSGPRSSSPRDEAVPVLAPAELGRAVAPPESPEPADTVAAEQSGRHALLTIEPALPKLASAPRGRADGA